MSSPTHIICHQSVEIRRLRKQVDDLLAVLKYLIDCPFVIEGITIPKAGIDANPEQVVGTMHISYIWYVKAREAIAKAESDQ